MIRQHPATMDRSSIKHPSAPQSATLPTIAELRARNKSYETVNWVIGLCAGSGALTRIQRTQEVRYVELPLLICSGFQESSSQDMASELEKELGLQKYICRLCASIPFKSAMLTIGAGSSNTCQVLITAVHISRLSLLHHLLSSQQLHPRNQRLHLPGHHLIHLSNLKQSCPPILPRSRVQKRSNGPILLEAIS